MKIVRLEKHSPEELLERLARVTMLTNPERLVYSKSYSSLEKIRTEFLSPPQAYVLSGEILKVRNLRWQLAEHGVDLFCLDGYVTIYLEDSPEPVDVLPPVVEESVERDGSVHNIVCDGMHRIFLARLEMVIPQVVFIRGLSRDTPYYAFPVPGGWGAVDLRDDLPQGYIKKWHRISQYKTLYRDFNSAFTNVGGPRGHFSKDSSQ